MTEAPDFIQGLPLSEQFYFEMVKPLLDEAFPGLEYAAALIGPCSDVLGYDTPISTDHHWGPRLLLFLPDDSVEQYKAQISTMLSERLPYTLRGYSTNFGPPDEIGVRLQRDIEAGPVSHMVEIHGVREFFQSYLGLDTENEITPADWLTFPEHRLLSCTGGKVFHDGTGKLTAVRRRLAYYPSDVWLYMLAAQWEMISEEEAFVGRCGDIGDELGSSLVAARLVQSLMKLCFLTEKRYAPYSKWFGTAFSELRCAERLTPIFLRVQSATDWRERERYLGEGFTIVATLHNELGITEPLETNVRQYYGRPYTVLSAGRFADALKSAITNPEVLAIVSRAPGVGAVHQFAETPAVVDNLVQCARLKHLYA